VVKNKFYKQFGTYEELRNHCRKVVDAETLSKINIVDKYKTKVLDYVQDFQSRNTTELSLASAIVSTTHKAKGLEFECVELGNDFIKLEDVDLSSNDLSSITEEVNLLYVAATRAKKYLKLNGMLQELLDIYCLIPKISDTLLSWITNADPVFTFQDFGDELEEEDDDDVFNFDDDVDLNNLSQSKKHALNTGLDSSKRIKLTERKKRNEEEEEEEEEDFSVFDCLIDIDPDAADELKEVQDEISSSPHLAINDEKGDDEQATQIQIQNQLEDFVDDKIQIEHTQTQIQKQSKMSIQLSDQTIIVTEDNTSMTNAELPEEFEFDPEDCGGDTETEFD